MREYLVYTDGVQVIVLKRKWAYHYNKAGSEIGRTFIGSVGAMTLLFRRLAKLGFERVKPKGPNA